MKEQSYTKAYEELQQIVESMENEDVSIDDLEKNIKRASELLKICKDKLHKTEISVLKNLEDIKAYEVD
jgi:exodeoxyribonuclease VII small subunit